MTIEEKAKAYDEALKVAVAAHKDEDKHLKATLERIFPGLKESEDKRIRKVLIDYFNRYKEHGEYGVKTFYGIPTDDILAWLEKKEPKKIEQMSSWSEEDKNFMYDTLSNLTELKDRYGEGYGNVGKCIGWLKTLKERYTWKPSDEQMKALRDLNLTGNISYAGQGQTLIELYNDLKKLKG